MDEQFDRLTRREFLQQAAILGLSASAVTLLDGCGTLVMAAPTPAKIPRIGTLVPSTQVATVELVGAFRQGLIDLGYIEGKNIAIEYRYGDDKPELQAAFVAELISLKVDILFTAGVVAVIFKNATSTIPIVFTSHGDPVGQNVVSSLAHPGGNTTGLSDGGTLVTGKRLELLKESIPGISRVAVPLAPSNLVGGTAWKATQEAAQQLGLQLQPLEFGKPEDFERVLASGMSRHPEALFAISSFVNINATRMVELATKNRLPSSFPFRDHVIAGGLMSYSANEPGLWYRAATYVNKILKGAKPGDIPVEQPTKFDFVINLKTSKELGLTIPQSVLAQATEVIQ